jgi:hypothetical protein
MYRKFDVTGNLFLHSALFNRSKHTLKWMEVSVHYCLKWMEVTVRYTVACFNGTRICLEVVARLMIAVL